MGMGEFNSGDHYIYYCEQESYTRNAVALIINKSLKFSNWVQPQKWQNDLHSFQGKPINITVIQVYAQANDAKEAEVDQFYEYLQELLKPT